MKKILFKCKIQTLSRGSIVPSYADLPHFGPLFNIKGDTICFYAIVISNLIAPLLTSKFYKKNQSCLNKEFRMEEEQTSIHLTATNAQVNSFKGF